jgi:hypothetical protein
MSRYALMIVLALRKREEEAATRRLADAMRAAREADVEAARREARAATAREKLQGALGRSIDAGDASHAGSIAGARDAGMTGVVAAQWERFGERRRAELRAAEAAVTAFKAGQLRDARAAEEAARAAHRAAHQSREILERHLAKVRSGERAIMERREADRAEDLPRRVATLPRVPGA